MCAIYIGISIKIEDRLQKNCNKTLTDVQALVFQEQQGGYMHKTALEKLTFIGKGPVPERGTVQTVPNNLWAMVRQGTVMLALVSWAAGVEQ